MKWEGSTFPDFSPFWSEDIEIDTYIYEFSFGASLSKTNKNIMDFKRGYENMLGGMCYKVCEKIW